MIRLNRIVSEYVCGYGCRVLNSKIIECRISEVTASGSVVNKSFTEDILAVFGKSRLIDLIIDRGSVKKATPSKIIGLTSKHLTRLR